jgi:hypothetical protein
MRLDAESFLRKTIFHATCRAAHRSAIAEHTRGTWGQGPHLTTPLCVVALVDFLEWPLRENLCTRVSGTRILHQRHARAPID